MVFFDDYEGVARYSSNRVAIHLNVRYAVTWVSCDAEGSVATAIDANCPLWYNLAVGACGSNDFPFATHEPSKQDYLKLYYDGNGNQQ